MNVPLITIPNFRPKCSKSIPVFRPKQLNGVFLFGISFFILQMLTCFVLCKLGKWRRHPVCYLKGKILNKEYLWKYKSSVLQTWHHKCSSQKKLNNTHSVIVMKTVLAPVSFCQKPNILIFNFLKQDRSRGSCLKQTW